MMSIRTRVQPLLLAVLALGLLALAALPSASPRALARPAGPPIVVGNDSMTQWVHVDPNDMPPVIKLGSTLDEAGSARAVPDAVAGALHVNGPVHFRAPDPVGPDQACEPDAADRLKGEGFEDVRFPRRGDKWRAFDSQASLPGQNDSVRWGRVTCQKVLGLAGLWSVGAGSLGGTLTCEQPPFGYPSGQQIRTELQYITFDLTNYPSGMRVSFDYMAKMPGRALYIGAGDWTTRASGLQVYGTGDFIADTGGQWIRGQVVKLQQDTIKKKKEVLLTFIYADPPPNIDGSPGTGNATPGMYGVFLDNVWIDGMFSDNPCFLPTETPRPIATNTATRTPKPTDELEPTETDIPPATDTPAIPPTRIIEPSDTPYILPTRPPTRTPGGGGPSETPYIPPTRPPTSTRAPTNTEEPTETAYIPPTRPPTRTPAPTETAYVPPTRPPTSTPGGGPSETPYIPPTRPPTSTPGGSGPTDTPYTPPTRPPTRTPAPTETPYIPPTRPPTRTPAPTETPYVPPTRPPTRTPPPGHVYRNFLPLVAHSIERERDIPIVPTAPTATRTPLPSATFTKLPPTATKPPTPTNTRPPTRTRRPADTDTPTPPPTPTYTPVPIPEVILDFLQPYTLGSELEIVRVRNIGTGPQDMSGWRVYALKKSKSCNFPPGLKLGPDETFEFQTGRDAQDVPSKIMKCDNSFIWDNNEDKGELYNRINVKVDTWCYERLGGKYPCP